MDRGNCRLDLIRAGLPHADVASLAPLSVPNDDEIKKTQELDKAQRPAGPHEPQTTRNAPTAPRVRCSAGLGVIGAARSRHAPAATTYPSTQ